MFAYLVMLIVRAYRVRHAIAGTAALAYVLHKMYTLFKSLNWLALVALVYTSVFPVFNLTNGGVATGLETVKSNSNAHCVASGGGVSTCPDATRKTANNKQKGKVNVPDEARRKGKTTSSKQSLEQKLDRLEREFGAVLARKQDAMDKLLQQIKNLPKLATAPSVNSRKIDIQLPSSDQMEGKLKLICKPIAEDTPKT